MPRVAWFADTFYEANGVGTISRQLFEYAKARGYPFLTVLGSTQTRETSDGSARMLELARSPIAFPVDKDLYFDPLFARHKRLVMERLAEFQPDLVHITGPGDMGFLGAMAAHAMHVPWVASWHTNFHEYLVRRTMPALRALPKRLAGMIANEIEQQTLRGLLRFYRTARFTMAPNPGMIELLENSTGKPSFFMGHGVDLQRFKMRTVARRTGQPFCIGYVGRLTAEKNVRAMARVEAELTAQGEQNFRFLVVGAGGQEKWLRKSLRKAEFAGVLRGEALAQAYASMDVLIFPSETDTFGLVVLEAMASGVPVCLGRDSGRRIGVEDGVTGFVSEDYAAGVRRLMDEPNLRMQMGHAARVFACGHGWGATFDGLYDTYAMGLERCCSRQTVSTTG